MTARFLVGNLFLLGSVLLAAVSQVLLKLLLDEVDSPDGILATLRGLLEGPRLLRGVLAGGLLGLGFICWLLCLTRLDLSYAYPVACTSVVLVTAFSVLVLGEPVTPRIWAGSVLILVGLALLTPPR